MIGLQQQTFQTMASTIKQGFSLPKPDISKFAIIRWIIGTLFAPLIMVLLKTRRMVVKGCCICYSIARERRETRPKVV